MRALACVVVLGAALVALAACDLVRGGAATDDGAAAPVASVHRRVVGAMVLEDVPALPEALLDELLPYQSIRSARLVDWLPRGAGMIVSTRFGDTTQLHQVAMPGGARDQITFAREPVTRASVRPLAGAPFGLLYLADRGGAENHQLYFLDWQTLQARRLSDGRSRNDDPRWSNSGERFAFSSNRRDAHDRDLYVGDTGGAVRAVLQAPGTWSVCDWSPDDARLLVRRDVSIAESYLYVLDLAGGQPQLLWPADGSRASLGVARYAPDGRGVFLTSDAGNEFERLFYVDVGTRSARVLSDAIPWDIEAFDVSASAGMYAFVANEDGVSRLRLRRLRGDDPVGVPTLPVGVIGDLRFSPEGDRLAFSLATPRAPSDVMAIEIVSERVQRWTTSEAGGLDRQRFVGAERVRLTSFDHLSFGAFVYRPAPGSFAGRRPVLIDVHGGPEAQARPVFDALRQFLVQKLGVVVIEPNVRGSTGYGKHFRDLDNGMRREDAVRDIGAVLDWVRAQPGMDATRVAITGGSYGGYVTLAALARYGTRLRAGVEIVGITNLVGFLSSTAPYRQALRRAEYGDERDPVVRAFLEGASPLTQVGRITQPVLIAQGANDPRVPRAESEGMVRALRQRDVPVWYLLARDEGHGFRRRANRELYDAAKVLFLRRHLLGEGAAAPRG